MKPRMILHMVQAGKMYNFLHSTNKIGISYLKSAEHVANKIKAMLINISLQAKCNIKQFGCCISHSLQ